LENRTLFAGLSLLPGGSLWTFRQGQLTRRDKYFTESEWERQGVSDPETFYQDLRETFSRNLPRYLAGDQAVGMSLTGGLDTRMVMAWQRREEGTLPCYTYGGPLKECRDVLVAREVARACRQPTAVISVGEDFLNCFAHYVERAIVLTDGGTDARSAFDVYVSDQARHIAPVRLTGLYGGEVLRRVRAFKPNSLERGLFAPLSSEINTAKSTYEAAVQGHPLSFAVFRQCPWHYYGSLCLEQTRLTVRTPFLDNEFVKTVFRAPPQSIASNGTSMRLIADGSSALAKIPTDRWIDGSGSFRELLQNAYGEFTFKAEYAYDYGMPQWLASIDHGLRSFALERLFLGRHKPMHFRMWYGRQLAAYVREVLLDPRSLARPFIDGKSMERIIRSHTRGDRNFTTEIHRLLRFELICRQFLDTDATALAPARVAMRG
jgi:asparagine synthase (glutamine-hydrolysing)